MTQILLNGKIYTVDGDDAVLLREAVATLEKESNETKVKLDAVNVQVTALTTEKNDLATQAAKFEAEATATKTKLDEATQQLEQKNDAADVDYDELIKERLEIWSSVLPVLRHDSEDYKPDYSLDPLHIKLTYLMKRCADKADVIKGLQSRSDALKNGDKAAIEYVEAMYTAFPPQTASEGTKSHTDSVLDSILFARHFTNDSDIEQETGGNVTRIDHRQELTKKLEAKNPKPKRRSAS